MIMKIKKKKKIIFELKKVRIVLTFKKLDLLIFIQKKFLKHGYIISLIDIIKSN